MLLGISDLQTRRVSWSPNTSHIEEVDKENVPSIEDYLAIREYEDVVVEIPGWPPNRDIDFFIDLVPRIFPMSKIPYRMRKIKLKEFQMSLGEILDKGYRAHCQKKNAIHCGCVYTLVDV